jgi:hypothetical protein
MASGASLGGNPSAGDKTHRAAGFTRRWEWAGGGGSVGSVEAFLRGPPGSDAALPEYAPLLATAGDPTALDDAALRAAGVAKIFHRRRLVRWAGQLQPEQAPAAMCGFERRGVHRSVVQLVADAACQFGGARRLLLADGATAVEITRPRAGAAAAGADRWVVQRRALGEGGLSVVRTACTLEPGAVVRQIAAAVGDRVLLGGGGGRALVVRYEGSDDRFAVLPATVAAGAHECNHGGGWACRGGAERWVGGGELQLDPAFTTKDGCEELVKPLAAAAGERSLVDVLADDDFRPQLQDPLVSGHLAAGFAALPPESALVAAATVFASHAWKYQLSDVASALELFEAEQPAPAPAVAVAGHFFWFDIFTVNQVRKTPSWLRSWANFSLL